MFRTSMFLSLPLSIPLSLISINISSSKDLKKIFLNKVVSLYYEYFTTIFKTPVTIYVTHYAVHSTVCRLHLNKTKKKTPHDMMCAVRDKPGDLREVAPT